MFKSRRAHSRVLVEALLKKPRRRSPVRAPVDLPQDHSTDYEEGGEKEATGRGGDPDEERRYDEADHREHARRDDVPQEPPVVHNGRDASSLKFNSAQFA